MSSYHQTPSDEIWLQLWFNIPFSTPGKLEPAVPLPHEAILLIPLERCWDLPRFVSKPLSMSFMIVSKFNSAKLFRVNLDNHRQRHPILAILWSDLWINWSIVIVRVMARGQTVFCLDLSGWWGRIELSGVEFDMWSMPSSKMQPHSRL